MPGTTCPDPSTLYAQLARLAAENLRLQARFAAAQAADLAQFPPKEPTPVTSDEFYDMLDSINRDFRRGRLSQAQHDDEVRGLVDAFENREAAA